MTKRGLALLCAAILVLIGVVAAPVSAAGVVPVAKVVAGDRVATVTWSPGSLPGRTISGFSVQHRKLGTATWASAPAAASARKLVVSSLVNGQTTEFRVVTKFAGTTSTLTSTALRAVPRTTWISVAPGYYNTCAINSFHEVWCWGLGSLGVNGAPGLPTTAKPHKVALPHGATQVVVGTQFACALLTTKTVSCWGQNALGELGLGSTDADIHVPGTVPGLSNITSITAGLQHACASTSTGTKCWGTNTLLQAGVAALTHVVSPTAVATTLDGAIVSASAGPTNTCGLTASGSLWCWGGAAAGVLGSGNTATNESTPQFVVPLSGGVSLPDVGQAHACTLALGQLLCWGTPGDGSMGILGVNTAIPRPARPTETLPLFTSVAAGAASTCGIDRIGSVWCFGESVYGELGTGIVAAAPQAPAPVLLPVPLASIAATELSYCGLDKTGGIWCWGFNYHHQLAATNLPWVGVPVQIARGV